MIKVALDPEANNEALLASLPRQIVHCLDERCNGRGDVIGYTIRGTPDRADLEMALPLVEAACSLGGYEIAIKELARLRLGTKAREISEDDLVAQLAIYAEEIQDYPPDVIRFSARELLQTQTFFPSIAELIAKCDQHNRARANLRFGLKRLLATPGGA